MEKANRVKISKITVLLLAAAGLFGTVNGANLLEENSSFEVGRWGFDPILNAFVQNWPNAVRPQVTDETAVDGKYSLKVSNISGMDSVKVIFPPMKFDGKTKVTVSFYAKSDRPYVPVTVALQCGWKQIRSKSFSLTDAWQRYSFSGELMVDPRVEAGLDRSPDGQASLGVYYLQFHFDSAGGNVFHQAWLDAVQIEKGELTAYSPARSLDAAIDLKSYPVKQHLVYSEGDNDVALLQLYSVGGAADFNVKYEVKDELTGNPVLTDTVSGRLDAGGHQTMELKLPEMLRGLYRIKAEVTSGGKTAQAQRVYGVIRDLRQRRLQGKTFFGGSSPAMIEPYRSYWMKPKDASYRLCAYKIAPEIGFDLAAKTGWQWAHFYNMISVSVNAKTEQEREWTESDIVTDMSIRHGMEPMSLMSGHGATEYLPKWILSDKKGLGGTSHGKGLNLVDSEKYAVFARDAAAHFKGRITWWENWNEPGVKMRDFEYLPIMKAFYEGVKSGNPDAKILGLCGTWDVGGDLYGWVKSCLKLGAGQYMDAVAIHGYHATDRHYAAEVQNIIKKQLGHELPVWDTESGHMAKGPYNYLESWNRPGILTAPNAMANGLTKHLANELASGVARQSWFNLGTEVNWLGNSEFSEMSFDGSPNATLIANNAIIDLLVDTSFSKELRVEGNTVAYLFDSPKGPICIYWNPSLKTTCSLPLRPDSIKLLDVFARELPVSGKNKDTTLPLDENVRYLICEKGSLKEFTDAVEKIAVAGLSPLKIKGSRLGVNNNQPELLLTLNNVSSKPQIANIAVVSQPDSFKVTVDKKITVPEFSEKTLVCPVSRKTAATSGNLLKLAISDGSSNTILSVPVNVLYVSSAKTAVPFGQPDATVWNSAAWVQLSDWAKMKALWDDNGLYFVVQVTDDAIVNYREGIGLQTWQSDGIELYFDWDVAGDFNETVFNADDVQLIMPVKGKLDTKDEVIKGPDTFSGNKNFPLNAAQMVSGRTKDGYWAQIEIKWSGVEALGLQRPSVFGFGVSVRDMDGSFKERKRAFRGGDNDNYKSTEKFGIIVLEK